MQLSVPWLYLFRLLCILKLRVYSLQNTPKFYNFRVSRRIFCFLCPKAMDLSLFFSLIKRFSGLTQLFFLCRPAPAFSRLSHKRFLE